MEQDSPAAGLKIDNSKSRFAPKEPDVDVEAAARAIGRKIDNKKEMAYKLGLKFMNMLKDRTVTQNKNQITKSMEKEVVSNLMQFAVDTNNDENELEGMGSIALSTLLFKSVLYVRDVLNEADYKMAQQAKQIRELEKKIENLSSNESTADETE